MDHSTEVRPRNCRSIERDYGLALCPCFRVEMHVCSTHTSLRRAWMRAIPLFII
jgi:hypothetical protein